MALFREVQDTMGIQPISRRGFHFALPQDDYKVEILIAKKDGQDVACWYRHRHCWPLHDYLFGATGQSAGPFGRDIS